ncbi:MAG: hypothetical protein ABJC13_07260 [Acidobacteriota bacterium]
MSRPVIRDPYYRKILDALEEGPISPDAFERCAVDLLRADFPGIALVPGGSDGGFDGAIPVNGRWWPLVCTTGDDLTGNLRENLKTVRARDAYADTAVFATTKAIDGRLRTALEKAAADLGFHLHLIHGAEDFVLLLYHRSEWCKELLGLDGQPSALSTIPQTRRPLLDLEPVGRESDIDWLLQTDGPRLLVGGRGSGKTFLLRHLMLHRDWDALFLARPDASDAEIANALRDFRPKIVVIDDAHVEPDRIPALLRLFREIDSSVQIVASTWEGGREAVLYEMGSLPTPQVRTLEPLTRDQIVEVMHQVGLKVDERTMRILVDQAANQPGLAVTIATLAREGAWQELSDGSAVAGQLSTFFDRFVGSEAKDVLACLSLGGDRGMSLEDVSTFLELRPGESRRIASGLASGGVLRELGGGVLSVWPRVFRSALLRTVFFSGNAFAMDFRKLIHKAPSLPKAVEAILSAITSGGEIDCDEVRELVRRAGSIHAWNLLAALDGGHAEWALENYPGDVREVAAGALPKAPDLAIRKILYTLDSRIKGGERDRNEAFGPLANWIEDLEVALYEPNQLVVRRRVLASVARDFLTEGGSPGVGLRAVLHALSVKLRYQSRDPGAGQTLSDRFGLLSLGQIQQLSTLWDETRCAVREIDDTAWQHLVSATWDWADPESAMMERVDEPLRRAIHGLGERVIRDLAPLARSSPGLSKGFSELAIRLNIKLPIERDPRFEFLFPGWTDPTEPVACREIEAQRVREWAEMWSGFGPTGASQRFSFYLGEKNRIGMVSTGKLGQVCRELACAAQSRIPWLDAFLAQGFEGGFVQPFLQFAVEHLEAGWENALNKCLGTPGLASGALGVALRSPDLSADLLAKTLALAAEHPEEIYLTGRREIFPSTLRLLLTHPSVDVSVAAAAGEWIAEPHGEVRPEVVAEWRAAIVRNGVTSVASIGSLQEAILLQLV